MAETQNKKKTPSKTASASKGGSRAASSTAAKNKKGKKGTPAKRPIRREVGGVVFLLLALFAGMGYVPTEALFIHFFANLLKGLFGYGFWVIPPVFFIVGLILLFHRGRPVRLRVTCMLLFPVLFGAILHVLVSHEVFVTEWGILTKLWSSGVALTSGGVISGAIGFGFAKLFTGFATVLVCTLLAVFCLLFGLQINPVSMYHCARERRVEYEPAPPREPRPKRLAEEKCDAPKQIDIPLDNEPDSVLRVREAEMQPPKRKGFFNRISNVMKPHELIGAGKKEETIPQEELQKTVEPPVQETAPVAAPVAPPVIDIPLDGPIEPLKAEPVVPFVPKTAPRMAVDPATGEVLSPAETPAAEPAAASDPADFQQPTKKQLAAEVAAATAEVTAQIEQEAAEQNPYEYPSYDLLNQAPEGNTALAQAEQEENLQRLSETLASFGVRAEPGEVVRGPSVTRYEFELAQGVKLSKVTALSDDLALALGVTNIRIAPIPEKISVIGMEVPNKHSSMVPIREVLESRTFCDHASKVAFSVGRDIAGHNIVGNISKLPHVLIAGTTGSGKSVCINSLIVSLLYKASPEEVRFIMVDPKMVELNPYNGIPHLLIPVVTDPKKAAGALQWAVFEMMKRYKLFSEHNVKDLASFNSNVAGKSPELKKMPTVVVVIDELADLMMVAAKEVEESICRVAQMGRAAGVHLVIATQRPSADIITGIMKANIPSRIAFAVASSMESRIILDMTGAEKLVGKGDMLYLPVGSTKPQRVQGCMITEEEIDRVVEAIKKENGEAKYSEEVTKKIEESLVEGKGENKSAAAEAVADDCDPLFDDAVEVLLETGQASVSMLQRRLKLGYSRAARLIDQMEDRGVVGPFEGSKPRQLLVSRASWDAYKRGVTGAPDEEEPPYEEEEPVQIDIPLSDEEEAEQAAAEAVAAPAEAEEQPPFDVE